MSSARSKRFATRQKKQTRQIITFRLRKEWFALPIHAVEKVIPLGKIHGDPQGTGISLTKYQDKEILVIDPDRRIFGETLKKDRAAEALSNSQKQRFLLIMSNMNGELIGLPIDCQPALRRITRSNFKELPPAYIAEGNIHCIASMILQLEDGLSLFILDLEELIEGTNVHF